ncbi:MAG TPA: YqaE/Pmp3 family membrane protein [Chitinophagaceae bacterium]
MKKIICSLLMAALLLAVSPFQTSAALTPKGGEPDAATVKAALAEFKNLSKQERKQRIKDVKKELKAFKKEKKANKSAKVEMVVLIILAILLPPLAVYLHQGEINGRFWLSILLWFCFIIPGVIYALLVVTDTV